MRDDIEFWEATLGAVVLFQEVVEEKTKSAISNRTKAFEKKLKEHLEELRAFAEKELAYHKFLEIILEDEWARKEYYNNPRGDESE